MKTHWRRNRGSLIAGYLNSWPFWPSRPAGCRSSSIDADEKEFSTGRTVHLNDWHAESKKAKGSPDAKKTNQKITQVTADLERYFTVVLIGDEFITPLRLLLLAVPNSWTSQCLRPRYQL
jgi:hypothetical protein